MAPWRNGHCLGLGEDGEGRADVKGVRWPALLRDSTSLFSELRWGLPDVIERRLSTVMHLNQALATTLLRAKGILGPKAKHVKSEELGVPPLRISAVARNPDAVFEAMFGSEQNRGHDQIVGAIRRLAEIKIKVHAIDFGGRLPLLDLHDARDRKRLVRAVAVTNPGDELRSGEPLARNGVLALLPQPSGVCGRTGDDDALVFVVAARFEAVERDLSARDDGMALAPGIAELDAALLGGFDKSLRVIAQQGELGDGEFARSLDVMRIAYEISPWSIDSCWCSLAFAV